MTDTSTAPRITVEICVDSIASALAAARGGAHRLELCASLSEGGITPSAGMIATVRSLVSIPVHVMIRPRGGDFCYSPEEFSAMKRDIAIARQLRADGIVFGILNQDASIDLARCRELLDCARPMSATFHRAFDMSRDLTQSLTDLISLGFDRLLTSGGEQKVEDAIMVIASLRSLAADHIALIIGSGVNSDNVQRLIGQTGVREVHASARRIEPGPMRYRNTKVSLTSPPQFDCDRAVADEAEVRNLVRAVSSL
jgi:copper homeostasis protein